MACSTVSRDARPPAADPRKKFLKWFDELGSGGGGAGHREGAPSAAVPSVVATGSDGARSVAPSEVGLDTFSRVLAPEYDDVYAASAAAGASERGPLAVADSRAGSVHGDRAVSDGASTVSGAGNSLMGSLPDTLGASSVSHRDTRVPSRPLPPRAGGDEDDDSEYEDLLRGDDDDIEGGASFSAPLRT